MPKILTFSPHDFTAGNTPKQQKAQNIWAFSVVERPLPNPNPILPHYQRFLPLVRGSRCGFRPCSYMSALFYHHKGILRLQTCL